MTEIAHADGYRDASNGFPICANPFIAGSFCWRAWVAGWNLWHTGA
jgi:hypothetical protein